MTSENIPDLILRNMLNVGLHPVYYNLYLLLYYIII